MERQDIQKYAVEIVVFYLQHTENLHTSAQWMKHVEATIMYKQRFLDFLPGKIEVKRTMSHVTSCRAYLASVCPLLLET